MVFGFILLLSSLARVADLTKCLLLNDKPFMARPALIDMNSVDLAHYSFMDSLNNFTGNGSALSPKICLPKETKYMNVKAFNMIKNKDQLIKFVLPNDISTLLIQFI